MEENNPIDEHMIEQEKDPVHMFKLEPSKVELSGVFAWTYYILISLFIIKTVVDILKSSGVI